MGQMPHTIDELEKIREVKRGPKGPLLITDTDPLGFGRAGDP